MEQFSMKHTPPLSLMDKRLRLEERLDELQTKKDRLTIRISEICAELSGFNNEVRGNRIADDRYQSILSRQAILKAEKNEIEKQLIPIKEEVRQITQEKNRLNLSINRIPMDEIQSKLLEMRDNYLAFSADTTRVSSMRAMSSKFVEEIQSVLKLFK